MAMAVDTVLWWHLPDLIVHQILQLLPTKSAIHICLLSKQWQDVCCLGPDIEMDEGGATDTNLDDKHTKFVHNILIRQLELCEKDPKISSKDLDKLKLRMTRYVPRDDANVVTRWLSYSCKRNVKELDISLKPISESQSHDWNDMSNYGKGNDLDLVKARSASRTENFYDVSQMTLANAKSLTSLNLEYLRLTKINDSEHTISSGGLLPCLKSLSLKTVHCDNEALFSFIHECPSVQHLSLTSCSFKGDMCISSSSLKSLEVMDCEAYLIEVFKTENLENFTLVSGSNGFPILNQAIFNDCINLKQFNICASRLHSLHLINGCHDEPIKGTIDAPKLYYFEFVGYLQSHELSLKAPNLVDLARIRLLDSWDKNTAHFNISHFTLLSDFLRQFVIFKYINLEVSNLKALIFPETFRKSLSSAILPDLRELSIWTYQPRKKRDYLALKESLHWMAPSLDRVIVNIRHGKLVIDLY